MSELFSDTLSLLPSLSANASSSYLPPIIRRALLLGVRVPRALRGADVDDPGADVRGVAPGARVPRPFRALLRRQRLGRWPWGLPLLRGLVGDPLSGLPPLVQKPLY